MWTSLFIWLSLLSVLNPSAPPCESLYGGCPPPYGYGVPPPPPPPKPKFVPAPPGKVPKCAKSGSTFCERIDHYPKDLIHYLVQKWDYDYSTLFADESKEEYNPRPTTTTPSTTYGPPATSSPPTFDKFQGYDYSPDFHAKPFKQPPANLSVISKPKAPRNQRRSKPKSKTKNKGRPRREFPYPGRRFPAHYATDAIVPGSFEIFPGLSPPPVTYYDPGYWWTRYKRSTHRQKRQAASSSASSASSFTLCPTRSQFVMPQAAINSKGNWKYVVNINDEDSRYKQLVRSEVCVSTQCNGICGLPSGYTTRCEQKYVQKRLIALQGEGNQLYTDVFWIPSCCVCQITPNNST